MAKNDDLNVALSRHDKNEYFLFIAKSIALGSKCPEGKQHGAIAVKHQRMVSTGYNGPASGQPHCEPCALEEHKRRTGKKCFELCPAVHAEINTIVTAAIVGTAIEGAILYVTKEPCADCLKALRNMHLSAVVFSDDDTGAHYIMMGPGLNESQKLRYRGK